MKPKFLTVAQALLVARAALTAPVMAQEVAAQAGTATHQTQSYVQWFIHSSGLIGLFILGLAIYFVVTTVRLFSEMRLEVAAPPEQMNHCQELIQQRDLKSVFSYVRSNDSYLCRMLKIGLIELPNGLAEARDTMERHGEAETVEMEKRISMLAVLGTLGPMIGLIGTLKGMIASFSVIAMSDMVLKASEVAGGISEALLLTFEGVALSVPAIYFYAVFRNRVSSISVSTMLQADSLLRQFAHAARLRSAPAAPVNETLAA
jgi:biopolymer transport protein ExbB